MPRPRQYDLDGVLDAAERLVIDGGRGALTIRALTRQAGVSNGAIYHAFGSVEAVVARAWLRRARQFLEAQRRHVTDARTSAGASQWGSAAVVAAADAVAAFGVDEPLAAQLLTRIDRDSVLVEGVDEDLGRQLRALDREVSDLMRDLADELWGRWDEDAALVMNTCLVRLPAALLFPSLRHGRVDARDRDHLRAAVGAVLAVHPRRREPDITSEGLRE